MKNSVTDLHSLISSRCLRVALSDPYSYHFTLCQFTVLAVFVQHSQIPALTIPLCVSLQFLQSSCSTLISLLSPFHFVSVYSSRGLRVALSDPCSYHFTLCQFIVLAVFVQTLRSLLLPFHFVSVYSSLSLCANSRIPALTIPLCVSLHFSQSSCSTPGSLLLPFHFMSVYSSSSLHVAL